MKKSVYLVFALWLSGCAAVSKPPPGIDPTLNWLGSTTDCTGAPLAAGSITYNVFIVAGPGPIPTITTSATELPCGATTIADRTKVQPLNAAPLAALTYHATLANGVYTAAVEAVSTEGMVSGLSNQKTFTVTGRPSAPVSLTIGP